MDPEVMTLAEAAAFLRLSPYATPDGEATHHVGPTDRLMAEMLCLSMADGYRIDGVWVHVTRARIVAA